MDGRKASKDTRVTCPRAERRVYKNLGQSFFLLIVIIEESLFEFVTVIDTLRILLKETVWCVVGTCL